MVRWLGCSEGKEKKRREGGLVDGMESGRIMRGSIEMKEEEKERKKRRKGESIKTW